MQEEEARQKQFETPERLPIEFLDSLLEDAVARSLVTAQAVSFTWVT
jgi:hypothetical protein